jgi:CO/xanthine dehydrogenase FAD-binding subunit
MIPFSFAYLQPKTLEEAVQAYKEYAAQGKKALYFGGGTEIITMGRVNGLHFDAVIDLKAIPDMYGLGTDNGRLTLGAAETLNSVFLFNGFPLLSQCCARVADHTAQCKITLGGNVAGTVIYHEAVLPLLLANATAVLNGPGGMREALVRDLFQPELFLGSGEFIVRFLAEERCARLPYVHAKHTTGEKIGYPLFTLAAVQEGENIAAAVSGLYTYPVWLEFPNSKERLTGEALAALLKQKYLDDPLCDLFASGEYRLFMLADALNNAFSRLGGEAA